MKKFYFFLIFITTITNAQIVNIPDLIFKSRLIAANTSNNTAGTISADGTYYILGTSIDTNGNGEIEFSEAEAIEFLDVSNYNPPYSFSNLDGIEAFTNLKILICRGNNINTINISNLSNLHNLENLDCSYNLISNLDLNGLNNLKSINCSGNLLTNIDFSVLPKLENANCASNQFTSLNFSNNPFFYDLGAANNFELTNINLQNNIIQNTTVGIFYCDGFDNCPNLNFICADIDEIVLLQGMLSYSLPNQTITIENCLLGNQNFVSENLIKVYPNPVFDFISINSIKKINSIQIFDNLGRIVFTSIINDSKTKLDFSNFSKGIYFLKVITNSGSKVEKFIKE